MPKISVIVPVYKAELYLSQCVESIKSQSLCDWELLLVDDGSPDNSGKLCDMFAEEDNRIRVFHKKNGGVSSARNFGLDKMEGDWVMFVDADDALHVDTLLKCYNYVEKNDLDVLQFSYTRDEKKMGDFKPVDTSIYSPEEYLNTILCQGSVWGNLIKSQIIIKNGIRFDEKMHLAEDQVFVYLCISKARRVQRIGTQYYYYRDNINSAMHSEKTEDLVCSAEKCISIKKNNPILEVRMDGLTLFLIERLILKREFSKSEELLEKLKPKYFSRNSMPTRFMAKISSISTKLAVYVEGFMLPIFLKIISFKTRNND